jgi:hypothetical protein
MRARDINRMFEMEVGSYGTMDKPSTAVAEYYINSAVDNYWKTRVSGFNSTGDKIEDTDKRVADLAKFIKDASFTGTAITTSGNVYKITLPTDFNMLISDSAKILPLTDNAKKCWAKTSAGVYIAKVQDTQEGRLNTINQLLRSSLSEYRLNNGQARPIRVVKGNNIEIYTDGEYSISEYTISYLMKPTKIDFISATKTSEYTFLPDSVINEVVRLAAEMYKDNVASKRQESLREVSTIE